MNSIVQHRRLKFVATLNDDSLPESTDPDYELEYIDIGNVDSAGRVNGRATYKFAAAPSRARRKVEHGDVIISTVRTYLQAIAPIENPEKILIVSTGFAVARPNRDLLDTGYFKYALREPRFLNEVVARSIGMSYPAINSSELADIRVCVPKLENQRRIATSLDRETARIDALVAEKKRMLSLLEQKRAALISRAVTRGVNPKAPTKPAGLDWLGEIPKHWEVKRGKFIFTPSALPVRDEDEIVTCFRDGQVTLRKNRREEGFTNAILELGYQGIRDGQLVLHSMDAFAGAIGVSDSDGKCSPEYIICDPISDDVHPQYFSTAMRLMALRGYVQAACTAVRERAPRIRFSHVANMFLPMPPKDEQDEIVRFISDNRDSSAALETTLRDSIALLKERRSALITAAVTGKIAV